MAAGCSRKFRWSAAPWLPALLPALMLVCGAASAGPAVRMIDDRGKKIVLALPAARIISLAPHLTELAFAAGAGGRLVGADSFSDHPAAAVRLSRIGDSSRLDFERIAQLRPDLVIAWRSGNRAGDIAQLEALGLPVFVSEPQRLSDIPRLLRAIGTLAGSAGPAESAAREFEQELSDLARRYGSGRPVSVFYQIWHEPLMTVNGEQLINEAIKLCGGRNIFAGAPTLAPTVSVESVLAADPEAIIASGSGDSGERLWQTWQRFPRLSAVKNRHLFSLDPDLIQRPGPRILQGARQMCGQLAQVRQGLDQRRPD